MKEQVKVRTSFSDSVTVIKSIDAIADAQGSSRSQVIRAALRAYIRNMITETARQEYAQT